MSDYLDRIDDYFDSYIGGMKREAKLEEFRKKSKAVKGKVYCYRYWDNCKKIEICDIGATEYYIKDNKKYFIGPCANIYKEIIELNTFHGNYFYMISNEDDAVEEFKKQVIKQLETEIEDIKKAKVM